MDVWTFKKLGKFLCHMRYEIIQKNNNYYYYAAFTQVALATSMINSKIPFFLKFSRLVQKFPICFVFKVYVYKLAGICPQTIEQRGLGDFIIIYPRVFCVFENGRRIFKVHFDLILTYEYFL